MDDPLPPAWALKRDGRRELFDADKISRALFAATRTMARPDALLARELADSVVLFLAREGAGAAITTREIEEVVVKAVRELGQPGLALAFEAHARQRVRRRGLAGPGPAPAVFAPDVLAAEAAGLLLLAGPQSPEALGACVLALLPGADLAAAVAEAARFVGQLVAIDGPEHLLSRSAQEPVELAHSLRQALRQTGLRAVVNLNAAEPPPWADDRIPGPLFIGQAPGADAERLARRADALLDALLEGGPVRIDWHLGEQDFVPQRRERLLRLVSRALEGASVGFVFDRPRRSVALAEGLDREHPVVLLTVGVSLVELARQPGVGSSPDRLRALLPSLTRLALSAGVQKRAHLRRQAGPRPGWTSGFLLDRGRLVVAPVGLDRAVRLLAGRGMSTGGVALDLARQTIVGLRQTLARDGRATALDTCVDAPFDFRLTEECHGEETVAGLTPWDPEVPPEGQLRLGGALHGAAGHGTLALFLPPGPTPKPETVARWLEAAWRQTEVVRVKLCGGGEEKPRGLCPPLAEEG
jgi:hypothetical protein